MNIKVQANACILSIASDSIYAKSIEHFIHKNFKQVMSFTNERLVFPNKAETTKCQYFLRWAYQVYCKSHLPSSALQEKLNAIQNVPIKIILTSKKHLTNKLSISLKLLEDKKILFNFEKKNKQLALYLRIRFAKAFVEVLPDYKGIVIEVLDKATLLRLKNMLAANFIIGMPVKFIYSHERIESVFDNLNKSSDTQNALNILEIAPGATMDEIKANYKRLLRQYHPDRVFTCDQKTISTYTIQFQRIQDAFELIKLKSA